MIFCNTGDGYKIWTRLVTSFLLIVCLQAQAGNQQEIALADSVRVALAHAVADGRPPKPEIEDVSERAR